MTDGDASRPRPQYGEYATPEEQAARIRQPLPPLSSAPAPAAPPVATPGVRTPAAMTPGRVVDRGAAVALLAYGLLSLANAIPAILDPSALLDLLALDVDPAGLAATRAWGVAAIAVLVLGWVLTAWLTWRAHRRGWVVFWIPLAGGLVFNAVSGVMMAIGLLADPAVFDAVLRQSGG
ncbi:DUF6264 family protein [Microbacterium sp. NPDC096154]|uniref:DUF6264 family protein n=1 Tax=Microbacterium sp. NPDC096154 TaxID=3155549 RepID=UPI003331B5A3